MKRKLMIVVEENGDNDGKGFNVHLEGDKERLGTVPESELTAAEFWGGKLFNVCIGVLSQSGAVKTVDGKPLSEATKGVY